MTTYVIRNGKLVEKYKAAPKYERSAAPHVISDIMDATRHMATGRMHTSKSAFRKDTKASGCVEYGTETTQLLKPRKPVPLDRGKRRDDIRRTIYEIKNGINR